MITKFLYTHYFWNPEESFHVIKHYSDVQEFKEPTYFSDTNIHLTRNIKNWLHDTSNDLRHNETMYSHRHNNETDKNVTEADLNNLLDMSNDSIINMYEGITDEEWAPF